MPVVIFCNILLCLSSSLRLVDNKWQESSNMNSLMSLHCEGFRPFAGYIMPQIMFFCGLKESRLTDNSLRILQVRSSFIPKGMDVAGYEYIVNLTRRTSAIAFFFHHARSLIHFMNAMFMSYNNEQINGKSLVCVWFVQQEKQVSNKFVQDFIYCI